MLFICELYSLSDHEAVSAVFSLYYDPGETEKLQSEAWRNILLVNCRNILLIGGYCDQNVSVIAERRQIGTNC
jgi:hypothetical protein